jgi:D-3-phosphoglycerate dehydrogenase
MASSQDGRNSGSFLLGNRKQKHRVGALFSNSMSSIGAPAVHGRKELPIYDVHVYQDGVPRIVLADKVGPSLRNGLPQERYEVMDAMGREGGQSLIDYLKANQPNYIVVRSATQIREALIAELYQSVPGLVGIGRAGIGVDNIDIIPAIQHGLVVQNAPEASVEAVGEHAVTLAEGVLKRIGPMTVSSQEGRWDKGETRELAGQEVLVIGTGRIGTDTASKFHALGCKVVGFDPFSSAHSFFFGPEARGISGHPASAEHAARLTSASMPIHKSEAEFEDLLRRADVITIHVPGGKTILGERQLALLKEGAVIVNTSRAEAIDHSALANAIEQKNLGVGLDVLPKEGANFAENAEVQRLLALQRKGHNILLTHHVAGNSSEAQSRIGQEIAGNIRALFEDGHIRNTVNAAQTVSGLREGARNRVRVLVFNRDQKGVIRKVSEALSGHNLHTVSVTGNGVMSNAGMDVFGFDVSVNGIGSVLGMAEQVNGELQRLFRDDPEAQQLLVKAVIL